MQRPLSLKQANRRRWIIAISIGVFGFLHEVWLIYLFPNIGIGALALPMLFAFAPCAGVLAYYVLDFPRIERAARTIKAGLIAAIVLVLVFAQLGLHPSWNSPFELITQYWAAFWQYPDKVDYQLLASGTHAQRVAAIAEYQDRLPDKLLVLKTYQPDDRREYYYTVEYRNGVASYDTSLLEIAERDGKTTFVTNPGDPATRKEYQYRTRDVEATLSGTQAVSIGFSFLFTPEELRGKNITGADTVFLQMLEWFR